MAPKKLPDQEYLRQIFDYDPQTGVLRWKVRPLSHFVRDHVGKTWNARYAGRPAGSPCKFRNKDYLLIAIDGVSYKLHRIVWKLLSGQEPPEVDHWNGNGLDNSKDNLRSATRKHNTWNRRYSDQPLPKGVKKNRYRWAARIMVDGVSTFIGNFSTPEEAHAAYCEAATRLHGEFANFGEDRYRTSP